MSEQKPMSMDTAPKDGTHILGYGWHNDDAEHWQAETWHGWCEVYWGSDLQGWTPNDKSGSEVDKWLPLPTEE